jgi:hypothetical protein
MRRGEGPLEYDLTAIKMQINVICLKKAGKFVRFPSEQNYDDGHTVRKASPARKYEG